MNVHSTRNAVTEVLSALPRQDKRNALLGAALDLAAERGLHDMPVSALARRAGVATGTVYLYFSGKSDLLNQLYLDQSRALNRAIVAGVSERDAYPDRIKRIWRNFAWWHLDNPKAALFLRQCEASSMLGAATLEAVAEEEAELYRYYTHESAGLLPPGWSRPVTWALFAGPVYMLSHLQEKGEVRVTEEMLQQTFQGILRAFSEPPVAE